MRHRRRWRDHHRPVDRAPAGTVLIESRGLVVERGGATLLTGVDVSVRAGEIVAVVGPNGAGKSTMLQVFSGDDPPTAGEVVVGGAPLWSRSPADLARLRAVLPQQVAMAFPFTVDEVVRMGRAPWSGTGAAEDDAVVAAALADCDVGHLSTRPFPTLSGGEQARVSLARVLVQQTQLLLLDEPTAALDLRHQEQVFGVVRRRADAGDGVVVVLHDLTAAAASADRIVLLRHGAVAADGPPHAVLDPDLLERVYEHAVEVFPNPTTGALTVVPRRPTRSPATTAARTGAR